MGSSVMLESPQMRWGFICKVYSILASQLLLSGVVASVLVLVRQISVFFATITAGLVLHFALLLIPLTVMWLLYYYHKKYPLDFFLLALFTITLSFFWGWIVMCLYQGWQITIRGPNMKNAALARPSAV